MGDQEGGYGGELGNGTYTMTLVRPCFWVFECYLLQC